MLATLKDDAQVSRILGYFGANAGPSTCVRPGASAGCPKTGEKRVMAKNQSTAPARSTIPAPPHVDAASRALVEQTIASIEESLVGFESLIAEARDLGNLIPPHFVDQLVFGSLAATEQVAALRLLLQPLAPAVVYLNGSGG
jgi:hypothetical protein